MVKIAPKTDGLYDDWLQEIMKRKKKKIQDQHDDDLILFVGDTGSGKSNLALHVFNDYLGEKATTDLIGLNKDSIAHATKKVAEIKGDRCCLLDEANINKRDSLSKFNKDMMDLFFAIRGLNVMWLWCNPSLDMMDKFFVKERISNVILVLKIGEKMRPYYYFNKKDILTILDKYGHLDLNLLKKVRKKYALYRGWFREYQGDLLKPYLEKKEERMQEKVQTFFESYSESKEEKWIKENDLFRSLDLNITAGCKVRSRNVLLNGGFITDDNYKITPIGHHVYKEEILQKKKEIIEYFKERRNSRIKKDRETLKKARDKKNNEAET